MLPVTNQNMFTMIGHNYANNTRVYYSNIVCLSFFSNAICQEVLRLDLKTY